MGVHCSGHPVERSASNMLFDPTIVARIFSLPDGSTSLDRVNFSGNPEIYFLLVTATKWQKFLAAFNPYGILLNPIYVILSFLLMSFGTPVSGRVDILPEMVSVSMLNGYSPGAWPSNVMKISFLSSTSKVL